MLSKCATDCVTHQTDAYRILPKKLFGNFEIAIYVTTYNTIQHFAFTFLDTFLNA